MAFFDKFPVAFYDVNKDGRKTLVVDILKRIVFRQEIKDEASLYYQYIIKDGESPEMVAHKFYGDAGLHWIILLLNEILDPYFEWPLSDNSLEDYTIKKYPGKALYIGNSSSLYFAKDEEVYLLNRSGTEYASTRGLVKEYDPTHRKLILYNNEGYDFEVGDVVAGKTNGATGDITRLVDLHKMSLHHFEDADEDYLYNDLDPLGTPPVNGQQVAIGLTGDSWENGSVGVTFGNTILHSYVNSLDASVTTHSVVTYQEYERKANENKRTVNILRDEFVTLVADKFNEVIKA